MVKKFIFYFSIFVFSSAFSSSNNTTADRNCGVLLYDLHIPKQGVVCGKSLTKKNYLHEWLNDPYQRRFMDYNIRFHQQGALLPKHYLSFDLYNKFLESHPVLVTVELTASDIDAFRQFLVENHIQKIRERHRKPDRVF